MATTLGGNTDNRSGAFAGNIHYIGTNTDNVIYAATANGSNDTLDGAGGNDYLNGGSGSDSVDGGTGNDTLVGGTGNDIYIFDSFGDSLTELANQGNDTLIIDATNTMGTGIALSLEPLVAVENLDISRTGTQSIDIKGNALANVLTGNDADNYMEGLAGSDTLIGGLGNDVLNGGIGADSMDGGAGDDIYFVDNSTDVIIDSEGLNEVRSTISYSIASNNAFDNLVLLGTANINATGNSINNLLIGNDGNNILDGGAGDDDMEGGKGNDTYLWRDAGDSFFEAANAGIDTLKVMSNLGFAVGADATLTLGGNVEKLDASQSGGVNFDLVGNDANNILTGNDADNGLNGGLGNDTLIGGAGGDDLIGGDGIDSLVGGIGNDDYQVKLKTTGLAGTATAIASLEDIIMESALVAGGNDSIVLAGSANLTKASTIVLAAGLENLYAYDTGTTKLNLTGNAVANDITGNDANNIILGWGGDDTLEGGAGNDTLNGGMGADLLSGGDGNDTYISELVLGPLVLGQTSPQTLDTYADDTSGVDTIKYTGVLSSTAFATFDLSQLTGYENIDISATGATKLNLTGNDAANVLTGNLANNTLIAGAGNDTLIGGAGNDTLIGGIGNDSLDGGIGNDSMDGGLDNDTYVVNSLLDKVTELFDGGTDTVKSSITYSLIDTDGAGTNGGNIENLTLTGVAAINGTGNALDNILQGNTAANILNGNGGKDTLIGGDGGDTYIVDSIDDIVMEANVLAAGGIDTVQSSVSFDLTDNSNGNVRTNIEKLTLTGTDNVNATGNALNNTLIGNGGNNVLDGGIGNDTLTGNAGNDMLDGGAGVDVLQGGLGDDTYTVDLVQTGTTPASYRVALQDTITEAINAGNDSLVLRGNFDHLNATTLTLTNTLENLNASQTGTTKLNLTGNALNNILTGNDTDNILKGGLGDDSLFGGIGSDSLSGEGGVDTLDGGEGVDFYFLDSIDDVAFDTGSSDIYYLDMIFANFSIDLMVHDYAGIEYINLGGAQNLFAKGNELANHLNGNGVANIIDGREGDDELLGGGGNDTINGGDGNDYLYGELNSFTFLVDNTSKDRLIGDAGNDIFVGGAGGDTLTGGLDADTFRYFDITESQVGATTHDLITDFTSGVDVIDLFSIDANTVTAGNQAFTFIDTAFTNVAGQLRFDSSSHMLYGDVNGNGVADFQIELLGVTTMDATDFIL